MKKNKSNYLWFSFAVAQCCISAFLFGEIGGWVNLLATSTGFIGYTMMTASMYRQRRILLLPK
jgi:hypothetical protein